MPLNEGDLGYSSLAAMRIHVTASVSKHGVSCPSTVIIRRYLSAIFTAE